MTTTTTHDVARNSTRRVPLTVVMDGRAVDLAAAADATVADLASVLEWDDAAPVWIDGRRGEATASLVTCGVVHGSDVSDRGPPATEAERAVVAVRCSAGPASGDVTLLSPGRYVLGRSRTSSISVDDPHLEPYAALIDVDDAGLVHLTQLAGRSPATIAGAHVAARSALAPDEVLELGSSRFVATPLPVEPAPGPPTDRSDARATPATSSDPWRRIVRRRPRIVPEWRPAAITPPEPAPTRARTTHDVGLGWITTLFALAGAVVIAAVMGSALFLVLGACAALGSAVVFVVRAVLTRRRRRDERRARDAALAAYEQEIDQQRSAFAAHLRSTVHSLDRLVEVRHGNELWQRRSHHDDAFSVSLGWGSLEWTPVLATADAVSTLLDRIQTIDDVLVTTTLSPGRAVAVTGDGAGIVRSLVVQLAVTMGPADWSLVVVADDPSDWTWCRWLPHLHGGRRGAVVAADDQEASSALFDRLGGDDDKLAMVLVVTDRPDLLAMRTGAIRRFLTSERPSALCVLAERSDDVPSMCTGIVHVRQRCRGRWTPDAATAPPHRLVHFAGMGLATAERVVRRLAALVDPEMATAAGDVPPEVGLTALLLDRSQGRITSSAVGRWWVDHDTPRSLSTVLGVGDGLVEVDLVTDGPHALIGGTTGSGKSELLRTLVVGLAARYEPARLNFVLVDYKGGSTFDACALLPHTVGMVTDLDDQLAERALQSLRAELRWREAELRARGVADLVDDPCRHGDGDDDRQPIARLVVVIDEFAALAAELPGFLTSLVAIAQRGRSLGVHLVLATQRPAGVVSDDIRANTNLRIALRLN
ncbi:MAG: FtsK/SpoIIIE domain-containing protein, partial [Actinomycetota bacterium]|nr:FtsK/SpoIIIE domain-containing protein [Actinomycetota bacterium]